MNKTFVCQQCGVRFDRQVFPSRPSYQFCSPTCRNKARILADVPCPICGRLFKPNVMETDGTRKKTCSDKCGHILRCQSPSPKKTAQEGIDEITSLYQTLTAKQIAEQTGRSASSVRNLLHRYAPILPAREARQRQRKGARQAMLDDNPMKRPGPKAKIRKWHREHKDEVRLHMAKMRRKYERTKPSGLEIKLHGILNALGIAFEAAAIIKPNFVVDVRIGKVIIQADGDYWHGHTRFEPLTKRQLAQQKRDRAQDAYLSVCGYTIIRVWESDMSLETVRHALTEAAVVLPG